MEKFLQRFSTQPIKWWRSQHYYCDLVIKNVMTLTVVNFHKKLNSKISLRNHKSCLYSPYLNFPSKLQQYPTKIILENSMVKYPYTYTHNHNHHFQVPSPTKIIHTVHAHQMHFSITVKRDDCITRFKSRLYFVFLVLTVA